MKFFLYYSFLTLFIITVFSQRILAQGCDPGTAVETLDAGNATISLSSSGLWAFHSNGEETPLYEWPRNDQGDGPGLVFTGNLWFGGHDDGGNLKVAYEGFGSINSIGYWPGPKNTDPLISRAEVCNNWDRLFKINKIDIENFQADFEDNQQLDDPVPISILGWPGRGNPSFSGVHGFDLPVDEPALAPFFDGNGNGIYEPLAGDYPLIKCADQAVWWVFNDNSNVNISNTIPMDIEIQILAYVYNSNNSAIYNSSFYDVKIINRGPEPLDSVYAGIWMDPDLGCAQDDYLGCVPEENLVYVYNADEVDGEINGTCDGAVTYAEPPMFGIKLLEGLYNKEGTDRLDLNSFLYNGNQEPNLPFDFGNPNDATSIYNVLTGRRASGETILGPNNEPTSFVFTDNPSLTPDGWSMCSEEIGLIDPRFVTSIGPTRLPPGGINTMTFALVVQPQPELPCPDISALIAAADLPVPSNEPNNLFCGLTVDNKEVNLPNTSLSVFPNPATDQLNFQLSENESFRSIRLYRIDGKLVRKKENLLSNSVVLSRNELPAGTYIYQAQTHSDNSINGKIILK